MYRILYDLVSVTYIKLLFRLSKEQFGLLFFCFVSAGLCKFSGICFQHGSTSPLLLPLFQFLICLYKCTCAPTPINGLNQ